MSGSSLNSSYWDEREDAEQADAESKAPAEAEAAAEEEDPDDDLAYRVAVLRSLKETGRSSMLTRGSGAASGQCSRWSAPERRSAPPPAHRRSVAPAAPSRRLPPVEAPPGWRILPVGEEWRLVRVPPPRAPETVGKAFRQAKRAGKSLSIAAAVAGADACIPLDVVAQSFTSAETDARRRRRKDQDALETAITLSQAEAEKKKKVAANASRHAEEQSRVVRILRVGDDDDEEEDQYFAFRKRAKDNAAGGSGGSGKGKSPM